MRSRGPGSGWAPQFFVLGLRKSAHLGRQRACPWAQGFVEAFSDSKLWPNRSKGGTGSVRALQCRVAWNEGPFSITWARA